MISIKSKLLFKSVKREGLKFASVTSGDLTIYYAEAADGADVWCEDADGNQTECPDVESVEIEGTLYKIEGSKMHILEAEASEEALEETDTPAADTAGISPELQQLLEGLEVRINNLEVKVEELLAPAAEPVVVEDFKRKKVGKIDLTKFGIY